MISQDKIVGLEYVNKKIKWVFTWQLQAEVELLGGLIGTVKKSLKNSQLGKDGNN